MKAIDWDAFAKEAKLTSPKYAWNYVEEADEQHEKLSWTACFKDACSIHRSDKEGSGWFPQGPKCKTKKKQVPRPSWYEELSDEEPV